MMKEYIHRNIENEIIEMSEQFPVIMITGPRQVGKTTMLNYILNDSKKEKIQYVSLDDIRIREMAVMDPELFLETYKPPLIIDEFQYAPKLLSYIKIIVDQKRLDEFKSNVSSNGLYYLTGSQSFLSMKEVSESLAGRVGIVDLYGLSSNEIIGRKDYLFIPKISLLKSREKVEILTQKELFSRIFKGSFPETYKNKNIKLETFFESYVKTYLERDIRNLINVKDEIKFRKFIVSVAARTGQELNLNDICNDVEISNPTANEWLSILVNSGLVFLLEPYSNNIIKRVVKRPKLYFMDTGLACYLTKYPSAEILENSAYAGAIFETYVVTEVIKSFTNHGLNAKRYLYYYRDNNKCEIDLIIDYNHKLYPIEIKKGKHPNKDCIKNFSVLSDLSDEVASGVVLCMMNEIYPVDRNNWYVPISYI